VYAYLQCAWLGELHKLAEVTKMPKNMCYMGSRSFKVIKFGTNQLGIYSFLFVTNSNFRTLSNQAMVTERSKIAFRIHPSHLIPSFFSRQF